MLRQILIEKKNFYKKSKKIYRNPTARQKQLGIKLLMIDYEENSD